jgi:hypothetical protein
MVTQLKVTNFFISWKRGAGKFVQKLAMKEYRRGNVEFQPFLTSVLDGVFFFKPILANRRLYIVSYELMGCFTLVML